MNDVLLTLLYSTVLKGLTVQRDQLPLVKQAAESLAETLNGSRKEIPAVALNAFLPAGHLEGLVLVRAAVTSQWPTFLSEHTDGGLPYLRAVGILALMTLAEDAQVGSALYLLLVDPLGRQGDAIEEPFRLHVLGVLRRTFNAAANASWTTVEVEVPSLTVKSPEKLTLSDKVVESASTSIGRAVQSTHVGQYHTPYNGYQNMQVPDAWAETVASAVTSATVQLMTASLSPLITSLGPPLKGIETFTPTLVDALQTAKLAERRMDVMWWMQARFSRSADVPYRTQSPWISAFRMAYDLDDLVPAPAPPEIEAVLVEAWHVLFSPPTPGTLMASLASVSAHDPEFSGGKAPISTGVATILQALRSAALPKLTQKQILALTGVAANTPITAPELALWIFRTYQADRLLR